MIRLKTFHQCFLVALTVAWLATPADAQLFHRRRCQPAPQPRRTACIQANATVAPCHARLATGQIYQPTSTTPQAIPQAVAPTPVPVAATAQAVASGDPYGFGQWLAAYRATRGLAPLAYSPELSGFAAANSALGFGHHGPQAPGGHNYAYGSPWVSRENVGWGSAEAVWSAWTTSNGHWQALLDTTATTYGIALVNGVWTYNAR